MAALLNVKQFVRFDEHGNLHVPNKLFVACQAYVQTPFLNDTSSRVATTEWVRAQISSLTGVTVSETDPIWVFEKALYYTKLQADARYLQSFTETDPTVPAWAKTSVKPTYTFAELLSKPTTIAGYGITDIPTTLPASDVYAWAKAATKPSYAYSEITGLPTLFSGVYADLTGKPTLFSGSYTDLTNKPTIPAAQVNSDWNAVSGVAQILNKPALFSGAYSDLTGKPTLFSGSYTDLTNKPSLFSGSYTDLSNRPTLFSGAYTDLTGKPTIPTNNNELTNGAGYLTSYTETDPIWTAEKTSYYTKTAADARYLQSYTETDPIWISEKANYALKTYVDTSISNLVASAPATLNTLNELALALGSDANFSTTVTTLIGTKEPSITAGTTLQYWRGDKSWQTLPIYTLSGLGGEPSITAGTSLQYWRGDKSWQTLPIYTLSGLGGQPVDADLTAIAALAGTAGFLKKTAADTWALDNSTYLTTASAATTYEPVITAGTISQYWRGDKSWQTLPTYNLSLYVPYTGATSTVNLGAFDISSRFTIANGSGMAAGQIFIKNGNSVQASSGFNTIGAGATQQFIFNSFLTSSYNKTATFDFSGLTNDVGRTYTFPNASGTIALTSDLSSYVPTTRTITINGTAYDLSADRAWTITTASTYTLPIATSSVLGGIKVGTNLSIDGNGVLSSTDTNTTYVNFTRTVAGLVPNPGAATTNRYLREDGTWVVPPDTDTDTVYVHPTTAGNKHIPAGGVAGQILRWSADGAAAWGADVDTDTNTWNANSKDVAGYVAAPGAVANKVWKTDAAGNPAWRDDADTDTDTNTVTSIRREDSDGTTSATDYRTGNIRLRQGANVTISEVSAGIFQIASSYVDTDTNTWNANTKTVAGYVAAPGDVANKVWKTNATGEPAWRDDADTDTNTTYTASTGLTLTGTAFSVTKTITASETADTIALRNASGQLVATGFYQASSRELKTNINPFTKSALDIIRDVTVVSFNYKTDIINKHVGFIAEDTPEELSTRNKNVMDSNNTIGVLLKAVQELEVRIKQLESK
jgi:hypothetical protein